MKTKFRIIELDEHEIPGDPDKIKIVACGLSREEAEKQLKELEKNSNENLTTFWVEEDNEREYNNSLENGHIRINYFQL